MTTLLATYHPAALKKAEMKLAPTFLRDINKLGKIIKGDKPQDVTIDLPINLKAIEDHLTKCCKNEWSFDLETSRATGRLLSIAFGGVPCTNPQLHPQLPNSGQAYAMALDLQTTPYNKWWPVLCRVFKRAKRIVVQNGAFDIPIMQNHGVTINYDAIWDTMLAGYILSPDDYVNLSHLCSLYLDVPAWKHLREDDLLHYNALDAGNDWMLYEAERKELETQGQLGFFENHLMPVLWKVIIPLNTRGMATDGAAKRKMLEELDTELIKWNVDLIAHFKGLGEELPIGKKGSLSGPKVKKLLYDRLGLPQQYHPTTRKVTTDQSALKKLTSQDTSGTCTLLLRRSLLKERELHANVPVGQDGRVHSRYVLGGDEKHLELTSEGTSRSKDKGTGTGRLASREPNLQNVPKACRVLYVPSHPEWWMVEADSSQIEARLTQWFSGDLRLKDAIEHDDIYLYTTLLVDQNTDLYGVHKNGWGALADRFTNRDPRVLAWREEGKRAFLGWSYRMGAKQLELRYGVPYTRAQKIIEALNAAFRLVVEYWEKVVYEAKSKGYVQNPYGRRRHFPVLDIPKVCNFKAQSTAADILFSGQKRLNLGLDSSLMGDPKLGYLLTTTHDSNLAEGPNPYKIGRLLKRAMEAPVECMDNLVIPCKVKVGKNWRDLKELK